MMRRSRRSQSIYHIVEKDDSGDEDIDYQESSEKVAAMDGKFFEQFIALRFADGEAGQDTFKPIQDESANNNSTIDFTQCRGIYKDIPRPTSREAEFFYRSALVTINQRLGVTYEVKELPNTQLFQYTQETLNMNPQEHEALLQKVSHGLPPPLIMVVDVISAKDLLAKDANGLSDPFCVLGIVPLWSENMAESPKRKISQARHDLLLDHASKDSLCVTEVKEKTLNPCWREQFRFDVGDVNNEQLQVEVWDHDEDSSVGKIIKGVGDVHNLKGMGRFFKEIAQSAKKDGKNLDDFLGWVTIPLNTISSNGLECSFPLQSRGKSKVEGELKLKLQLALKKDAPKASTEAMGAAHQYLWYEFTHHEVCDNAMTQYRWNGQLPQAPKAILHQLAQQQQLPEIYQLASQWIAYSQQCVLPHLDLNVMLSIITGIANLWDQGPPDEQMVKYICKSCREFVDHSMRMLQKQHEAFPFRDTEAVLQLHLLLRCMVVIKELSEKLSWDIFEGDVKDLITDAIKKSTKDWLLKQSLLLCEEVHEAKKNVFQDDDDVDADEEEETEESKKVAILVNLIENMINHVKVQIRPPALIYKKAFDIDFTRLIHMELAEKIISEIKELVSSVGKLSYHGSHQTPIALFSLYLAVRGFHAAADKSYRSDLETKNYYMVFKKSVEQWFELARIKARARIQKAVEVDEVRLVDSMVKHSSSAVDVNTTFVQIKEFWTKLSWPDKSGAYVFIAKVTDDIRQGAVDYANIIHKKLEENKFYDDEGQFDVTDQLCIAVNNIEQVRRYLSSLPVQLDFERVLDGLLIEHGSVGSEQCGLTLHTMLASADEDMLNVIGKVIRHVGEKMEPDFRKYTAPLMSAAPDTNLDDVSSKQR
nr:LOW QUALITY PROTEIN: BAI1-associated protein 3-like [Lytechinus pictus]